MSSGAHFDDLFARIREAAALVAARAEFVRIDEDALRRMCEQLAGSDFAAPGIDPAHRPFPSDETTLAYVVTVDALNFGSGWFPVLRKRDGASGYMTISTALRERFEKEGPFTAAEMSAIEPEDVAALFGQALENREAMELMSHFARALRDLGELLQTNYDGRFEELVESAAGRACALVERLHAMPLYRDVANYHGLDVPLYKRAQITASDLAHAFGGEGLGHFEDLDELTLFADNLVPHVLRRSGVLAYDPELAARIDAAELLVSGSPEEIEIRAVALHAVEGMVTELRRLGRAEVTAAGLDGLLWNRGQDPAIKAHPRHRARSVFY